MNLFPRKLIPKAKTVLEAVEQAIIDRQVYRVCPKVCITMFIIIINSHPTGIIGQWDTQQCNPVYILRWIFLSR